MEIHDPGYKSHFHDAESSKKCLNEENWERNFREFFKNATKRFSSSLYVTSNDLFDEIYMIQNKINKLSKSGDYFLSSIAEEMKGKFDKYWGIKDNLSKKIYFTLYVVVVLDPRKSWGICVIFETLYRKVVVKSMINHMNTILTCLFDHYYSINSSSISMKSEGETSRMVVDDDPQKFLSLSIQGL